MENLKFNYQCNPLCGFLTFPGLPVYLNVPSKEGPVQMLELNLRQVLPKTVSRYQRNCGKKITQNDGMLIKSYRTTRWTD